MTNRDFYLAIAAITRNPANIARNLEDYLRALWQLAHPLRDTAEISAEQFLHLLADACTAPVPPFRETWSTIQFDRSLRGYPSWENQILRQIVDLHQMALNGQLQDPMRSFGIFAPRGSRWYNFTIENFLECGTAGWCGGWQEGDDTGRDYVPGPVAAMDSSGQIVSVDPRDIPHPVEQLPPLSWDLLRSFLGSGQTYE